MFAGHMGKVCKSNTFRRQATKTAISSCCESHLSFSIVVSEAGMAVGILGVRLREN